MKKFIVGVLAGVVLGAGAASFFLHREGADAAKAEAKPAEKPKENPLKLTAEKRKAAGITLARASEVALAPEVPAFGRVLDAAPLVALVAEQETARAALNASEKEQQRAQKLFAAGGNASAQTVEAAEAAVARDRAALASARARLLATWGRALATGADLRALTEALEQGRALVRLDVLSGETPAENVKTARLTLPGASEAFDADVLGAAPVADAQTQGMSYLALVKRALPAGALVRGTLAGVGEPQAAVVVPRSAVVYHQGSAWIYVLGEEDTFERKLVVTGRSIGNTVTLTSGADTDEQIVTTGAQQLLSAELQAGGAPEEG